MKTNLALATTLALLPLTPLGAQEGAQPEIAERIAASEYVVLAEVQSLATVGEEVDAASETIVKTYRATVKAFAVAKGTIRSDPFDVEYTKRIGVKTIFPEVTLRNGFKYAFFLSGTGKKGAFRVYDPYFGAVRLFSGTADEVTQAAKALAGRGKPAGTEPDDRVVAAVPRQPDPVVPKQLDPVVPKQPDPVAPKQPDLATPESPDPGTGEAPSPRAETAPTPLLVDGFKGRLDGPALAFASSGEARVWFVVENSSPESRAIFCGDLGPFLFVELRGAGGGEAVVRTVAAKRPAPTGRGPKTILAPGEAIYYPLDLGTLFDLGAGLHRIRAILDLPAEYATTGVGNRAWSGRLLAETVEVRIGGEGAAVPRKEDSRFVRSGRCTEVHEATFEIGACARCSRPTSSRARVLCLACSHELGVCGFCLKKK